MSLVAALDFTDKHILVCGGSDGIGYGVATAFYEAGATVSITGTRSADSYDNDFSHFTYYQLCLLYTSPSPRDKRQSRMPSSA